MEYYPGTYPNLTGIDALSFSKARTPSQSGSSSADPGMDVGVDLRPSFVGQVTQGSLIRIRNKDPKMAERLSGTVKWFNDQKGFSFITPTTVPRTCSFINPPSDQSESEEEDIFYQHLGLAYFVALVLLELSLLRLPF
ncbi:hypothetical protein FCV25MIE_01972 [Fagus crenata]